MEDLPEIPIDEFDPNLAVRRIFANALLSALEFVPIIHFSGEAGQLVNLVMRFTPRFRKAILNKVGVDDLTPDISTAVLGIETVADIAVTGTTLPSYLLIAGIQITKDLVGLGRWLVSK